jgi:hypothetical protein
MPRWPGCCAACCSMISRPIKSLSPAQVARLCFCPATAGAVRGGVFWLLLHRAQAQRPPDQHPLPADVLAGGQKQLLCAGWPWRHGAWPISAHWPSARPPRKPAKATMIIIEEPTLDIEQVNQQSLRLIRLALLAGFIGVLYWVWADLISVYLRTSTTSPCTNTPAAPAPT